MKILAVLALLAIGCGEVDDTGAAGGMGGTMAQQGTGGAGSADPQPECDQSMTTIKVVSACPGGCMSNEYGSRCTPTCIMSDGSQAWGCKVKSYDTWFSCLGSLDCSSCSPSSCD